jgi:hypothetical protein
MIVRSQTRTAKVNEAGYIDKTGRFVIEPRFTLADWFSEGLAAVRVVGGGRRIKYIDKTGQIVIDSQEEIFHCSDNTIPFFPLFTFHEGFRRIRNSEGKYGFIGNNGKIIIEPVFDQARSFSEGLAAVRVEKKWGYVNQDGDVVRKPNFDNYPGDFHDGLAYVVLDGKYGYIDKQGIMVIKPAFESGYPFSESLAAVEVGGKWGYIDSHGNFVIEPQFDSWLGSFKEERSIVAINSKWQIIDKTGRIVVEPGKYSYCRESGFSDGLSVVKDVNDKYGFINTEGILAIGFNFDYALAFSEDLAAVKVDGVWGYVDKKGKFIIKPSFSWASSFSEGLAAASAVSIK